jgi:two-component system cell cycle sensor histidine kinase/response regulator CckA
MIEKVPGLPGPDSEESGTQESDSLADRSLREKSERILMLRGEFDDEFTLVDAKKLVHELRTHQIELELQNLALGEAQLSLGVMTDKYRNLYDNAPVGYFRIDDKSILFDYNNTLIELLGRPITKGSRLSSFVFQQDEAMFFASLRKCLAGEKQNMTLRIIHPGGDVLWVKIDAVPELNEQRDVVSIRCAMSDIDELKQHEVRQHQREREMLEQQKIQSLGILAGGIAHDFNNLLSIITGNLQLLREQPNDADVQFSAMDDAVRRATQLCRQMLVYAGHGEVSLEVINVNRLIDGMMLLLRAAVSNKVAIEKDLDPDVFLIKADATQISQVILNLVLNATEASAASSATVLIRTRGVPATSSSQALVCLEVIDQGEGMDKETRERLFEPYFSTKYTGRGLGMASVLGIVQRNDATIAVMSQAGRGTTVRIHFLASDALPTPDEPSTSDAAVALQSGSLLIVDDEAGIRLMLGAMLERHGYRILEAASGDEALVLIGAEASVDGLILDWNMPGLSREPLVDKIVEQHPDLPIVIMSGFAEDMLGDLLDRYPRLRFCQKPFTLESLLAAISASKVAVGR